MDQAVLGEHGARAAVVLSASVLHDMEPGVIARAREFTRAFLTEARTVHGLLMDDSVPETAQLVVSELATNAYRHAPGPSRVTLTADSRLLTVSVQDFGADTTDVVVQRPDPERVGGHGLEIVRMLCAGFEVCLNPDGKTVHAKIPLAPGR